jgi:hypothetical protein
MHVYLAFRLHNPRLIKTAFTRLACLRLPLVELCFENSKTFCKNRYKDVYNAAVSLQKAFRKQMDKAIDILSSQPPLSAKPSKSKFVSSDVGLLAVNPVLSVQQV